VRRGLIARRRKQADRLRGSLGLVVILVVLAIAVALFVALPVLGLALWALVSTVFVGLVIGALGRLVVPGRQSIGLLATLLVGLVGSIVGGYVGNHVLLLNRALTVLLEIGVAASMVAVFSGVGRLQRRREPPRLDSPNSYPYK
jgi:uncharacterized membrane protein YeaQ/YmgE (transglycosylase-associated protein family)